MSVRVIAWWVETIELLSHSVTEPVINDATAAAAATVSHIQIWAEKSFLFNLVKY